MELWNRSNVSRHFQNSSCWTEHTEAIIYWAMNCYGVNLGSLLTNLAASIIGVIIVFLNSLAIVAVFQRPDIVNPSDFLIAALALADCVVGIFLIYHSAYNLGNWQIFHECLFRLGILLGADLASAFHLCFLTLDRFFKITRPYIYQRIFTKNTVLCVSAVLWIAALALGFLPMFGWNNGFPPPKETQCGFFIVLAQDYNLLLVLLFLIPFIVNIILYGHIFIVAHKHANAIADQQTVMANTARRPSSGTWKFTKTVCILMGLYFFCWMPIGVYFLLDYRGHLNQQSLEDKGQVLMYLNVPACVNSMVNPIIYAVKIPYVKQRFSQIPCCCCYLQTKLSTTISGSSNNTGTCIQTTQR